MTKELQSLLDQGSFFDVERAGMEGAWPGAPGGPQWTVFLQAHFMLARYDKVVADSLDSDMPNRIGAKAREMVLSALFLSGNGHLLQKDKIRIAPDLKEPDTLTLFTACLHQGGDSTLAAQLLARLAQDQGLTTLQLRSFIKAHADATGGGDFRRVAADLKQLGVTVPTDWLTLEMLRHMPEPNPGLIRRRFGPDLLNRGKQTGALYPTAPDRCRIAPLDGPGAEPLPRGIPDDLSDRIARYRDAVLALVDRPAIAAKVAVIQAARERFHEHADAPIQIISTGRAGTTAVFEWLNKGPYLPYHSFGWQTAGLHRWGVIARLVTGPAEAITPDALAPFVEMYLSCRISELVHAYRQNRTPVIVSHWDAIYAPIALTLLGAEAMHLRRDTSLMLKSFVFKNMYAGNQIAVLPRESRDTGGFLFDQEGYSADWGYHIGWYLKFTEKFWSALAEVFPSQCQLEIASEGLFDGRLDSITALKGRFPQQGDNAEAVAAHFSQKINEKARRAAGITSLAHEIHDKAAACYEAL